MDEIILSPFRKRIFIQIETSPSTKTVIVADHLQEHGY